MSFGLPNDDSENTAGGDPAPPPEQPAAPAIDPLELEEIGAYMLGFIVDELEKTDGYDGLPYPAREQLLERIRRQIRKLIDRVIVTLHGADFPACRATLETVALKSGITGRITIARTEPNRHELFDSVGKAVLILLGDPEAMMKGANDRKPKSAQMDLYTPKGAPAIETLDPIAGPDDDEDGDGAPLDEPEPEVPGEWIDVSTIGEMFREMHTGTQQIRRSRAGLAADLVERLSTYNLRTNVDSINIDHDEIGTRTRTEILAALQWIDAVLKAEEDNPWPPTPTWMRLPKELQP